MQWMTVASLALMFVGNAPGVAQEIGTRVPPLDFEVSLQGPEVSDLTAAGLADKVTLLEFWATWCGPCLKSMPHLAELEKALAGDAFQFVLITDEERPVVERFLAKRELPGAVVLDADRSVFEAFDVRAIPRTIIVDRKGVIVFDGHPMNVTREMLEQIHAGDYVQPVATATPAGELRLPDQTRFFPGVDPLHIDYREAGLIPKAPHTFSTIIRPTLLPSEIADGGCLMAFGENPEMGASVSILGGTAADLIRWLVPIHKGRRLDLQLDEAKGEDGQVVGRWDLIVSRPPGWTLDEATDEFRPAVLRILGAELIEEDRLTPTIVVDLSELKGGARESSLDPMNDPAARSYLPVSVLLQMYERAVGLPLILSLNENDPWHLDCFDIEPWDMEAEELRHHLEAAGVAFSRQSRELPFTVARPRS